MKKFWQAIATDDPKKIRQCLDGGLFSRPMDLSALSKDGLSAVEQAIQQDKPMAFSYIVTRPEAIRDFKTWDACVNYAMDLSDDSLSILLSHKEFRVTQATMERAVGVASLEAFKLIAAQGSGITRRTLAAALAWRKYDKYPLLCAHLGEECIGAPGTVIALHQQIRQLFLWSIKQIDRIFVALEEYPEIGTVKELLGELSAGDPEGTFRFLTAVTTFANEPHWPLVCLLGVKYLGINFGAYLDEMSLEAIRDSIQPFVSLTTFCKWGNRYKTPILHSECYFRLFEQLGLSRQVEEDQMYIQSVSFNSRKRAFWCTCWVDENDLTCNVTSFLTRLAINHRGSGYTLVIELPGSVEPITASEQFLNRY